MHPSAGAAGSDFRNFGAVLLPSGTIVHRVLIALHGAGYEGVGCVLLTSSRCRFMQQYRENTTGFILWRALMSLELATPIIEVRPAIAVSGSVIIMKRSEYMYFYSTLRFILLILKKYRHEYIVHPKTGRADQRIAVHVQSVERYRCGCLGIAAAARFNLTRPIGWA